MGLGARFEQWLSTVPPFTWIAYWFPGLASRFREAETTLSEYNLGKIPIYRLDVSLGLLLYAVIYTLTGFQLPIPSVETATAGPQIVDVSDFTDNPRKWMREHLRAFGQDPETQAFAEFVGTIITEPVVSLLETYAAKENPDPHEMARAFHGIASGLPWAAETVDSILRGVMGDRAPQVGKSIMALYWGLGLGFLGWQTLAPLLSSGLQPNLERYYNKLYRPARFTPTQARDVFALGLWTADQMRDYLRELGWRDADIATWLTVSYRDVSEGIVWDLFERGQMSQPDVAKRLRKLGYNPDDIPLLFRAHEKADTIEVGKYTLSTAKAALKAGKIGTGEFSDILRTLKYNEREIVLQIQLIQSQRVEEQRDLTAGQIKSLYSNRIIAKNEAIFNLQQIRYAADVAADLVAAWDNEALPKAARINRGTIIEGYINGALSRDEAKGLLIVECGYIATQAELILKIEETSASASPTLPETAGPGIGLSTLIQFAQSGLLPRAEFVARQELARFTAIDRERLAQLAYTAPVEQPVELAPDVLFDAFRRGAISLPTLVEKLLALGLRQEDVEILIASRTAELSPSVLAGAYVAGVISREDLAGRLIGAGLTAEDTEIFIRTVELENPDVFGEFTARFLKRASVGSLQLALQRGLIDAAQFSARLTSYGYTQDAVEIYLFNAQYQAPADPKTLSKTDILSLYQSERFTKSQALQRLVQIGYTIEDATLLVEQRAQEPEDTDIGRAYMLGLIDQFGAASFLTDQGFSMEQIDNFFTQVATGAI